MFRLPGNPGMVAAFCGCVSVLAPASGGEDSPETWESGSDTFRVVCPAFDWETSYSVSDVASPVRLNTPLRHAGAPVQFEFHGGGEPLIVRPAGPGIVSVTVVHQGVSARFRIQFFREPRVVFDEAYRSSRTGKVTVEVPEVYELFHVALAFTNVSDQFPSWLQRQGSYWKEVQEAFGEHEDHELVSRLDEIIRDGGESTFLGLRGNSYCYEFEGDHLVPRPTHSRIMGLGTEIEELLPHLEDFAKVSRFRSFYRAHLKEYQAQEEEAAALLDAPRMWRWLEREFSSRYESYRVVFSPLTYGTHNAVRVTDRDFSETIVLVAAPQILDDYFAKDEWGQELRRIEYGRLVFTEFDHNYVNPATDLLGVEIADAFKDLSSWNTQDSYGTPLATFNEYLTWAAYVAYVFEHEPESLAEEGVQEVIAFMEQRRGFPRFGEFVSVFQEIVDLRDEDETLESLIPDMIDQWRD